MPLALSHPLPGDAGYGAAFSRPTHSWLRKTRVALAPSTLTPLLSGVLDRLRMRLGRMGHTCVTTPDDASDILLTTAPFGEPLPWRQALLFTARVRFKLRRVPTLYTLMHATPEQFRGLLNRIGTALCREPVDPAELTFPGMAPDSHRVLVEQGRRGGPIVAMQRVLQAQAKGLRIILVVGYDEPLEAYHFDLVGAYPRCSAQDADAFYEDMVLRMITAVSTSEVTEHQMLPDPVPQDVWQGLSTREDMCRAGQRLGEREFFTDMVRIADLVHVPSMSDAVASQYSEGCFATWDPSLGALIATATGSARPVDKGRITEEDLSIIAGLRSDGKGALVRRVAGRRDVMPSSEAVEMMGMDAGLPFVSLNGGASVPVIRSKLHGHRGIAAYDPLRVEFVRLDAPYYHYPVSCATVAQAQAIVSAFSRSEALTRPEDPRQVVFTVLPGHGVVMAEKWVPGTAPFQTLWEAMDAGHLVVENRIPQGELSYAPGGDGRMHLQAERYP